MKALDIMATDIVSVGPETDVCEVARILLTRGVSAAPVVGRDGQVLGVVSEGDLMRRAECGGGRSWWLSLFADDAAQFVRVHGTRARDVMSREVVSVGQEATLAEIAGTLERHAVKRVPVIEKGRIVGIVSRADVLRGLASLGDIGGKRGAAGDSALRQEILDLVRKSAPASMRAVSIIVVDGAVYLWGLTDSEIEREAVRVAAETIAGTSHVHDYLNTLPQVLRGL